MWSITLFTALLLSLEGLASPSRRAEPTPGLYIEMSMDQLCYWECPKEITYEGKTSTSVEALVQNKLEPASCSYQMDDDDAGLQLYCDYDQETGEEVIGFEACPAKAEGPLCHSYAQWTTTQFRKRYSGEAVKEHDAVKKRQVSAQSIRDRAKAARQAAMPTPMP